MEEKLYYNDNQIGNQSEIDYNLLNKDDNKKDKAKILFHENLEKIKKIQNNIISSTQLTKEKIISANEISNEQIKNFKENTIIYGKYLKSIHGELAIIQDLMK
jgi:hypothetical protein